MTYTFQPDRVEALNSFIEERERIRIKKETGHPRPWTTDPIFQKYKFCNVHREDDRTTRWISDHWRNPHQFDPDLWFALVIARRALNWPGSMEELGYPVPWIWMNFSDRMQTREMRGQKCYDTAYQLLVQGKKGNKCEMLIKYILNPLWEAREHIRPREDDTLQSFFDRLAAFKYMGLFYTGQVVADLKYAQLCIASDWDSFVVPGPGSERGLNRVLNRPYQSRWKKDEWLAAFRELHPQIRHQMHAQDLQNCLCEFDKYERISKQEGKVRPYTPTVELSELK